jgi:hypothetical protein
MKHFRENRRSQDGGAKLCICNGKTLRSHSTYRRWQSLIRSRNSPLFYGTPECVGMFRRIGHRPFVGLLNPILGFTQWFLLRLILQRTQNNSDLRLRHSKWGREGGRGGGKQDGKRSKHVWCNWKHFSFLILTDSVAFWYSDFIVLYFVNKRDCGT